MPKKIEPKWGHGFHHILGTFNETLYSDEDVRALVALLDHVDDIAAFQ